MTYTFTIYVRFRPLDLTSEDNQVNQIIQAEEIFTILPEPEPITPDPVDDNLDGTAPIQVDSTDQFEAIL